MFRDTTLYVIDIFIAFDKILRYTKKFTNAKEFLESELEWDATIRELEIIGEATNTLLKLETIDNKYRRIVDFRNQIAHGYFGIDEEIVWDIIKNKLPQYMSELKDIIKFQSINLSKAIVSAKKENSKNKNILTFLNNLESELYM